MSLLPRWLRTALLLAVALVGALLWAETQRWRPFYSVGDEALHVRTMMELDQGAPLEWRWARGDIQRNAQYGWWRLAGSGPGRLLDLGLLVFAAELLLLWTLTRRWLGPVAAAWALLADLLCADTWLRARSILGFHWLPLQMLVLAWLAGKVRARWAATAWAALAACLVLDYEGALVALPGLLLLCLTQEEGLRRRWAWTLGSFAAAVLAIQALQSRSMQDYAGVRHAASVGGGLLQVLPAWGLNLWQLLVGGEPLPYFSVGHWPAFALWALPLVAVGAVSTVRSGRWAWCAWAAFGVLATQASLAPHGVPAHRLVVAWVPLCMLAGAGGAWLQERLEGRAGMWLGLLLLLGLAAEADAYFRHMAVNGSRQWGRSGNMAAAAALVRQAPLDTSVDSALLEARYPDLRFHLRSRQGAGATAWVLLPPEQLGLVAGLGQTVVVRVGNNDEPMLLLKTQGAQTRRFDAMEADLRTLLPLPDLPGLAQPMEQAWLRRSGHDDWALWAVICLDLHHYFDGLGLDPLALEALRRRPPLSPAPWVLLGRASVKEAGAVGLRAFDKALDLAPDYIPALIWKAVALEDLGRFDEARSLRALAQEREGHGAWMVGE